MSLLISFEGIDGSGKSTVISKVEEFLSKKEILSIVTREPRGTELGRDLLKILEKSEHNEGFIKSKWTRLFLFLAAHAENLESVVKPSLAQNLVVIADRFIDSMFVYQGLNKKLGVENIELILKNMINTPFPDLTFFLDIDPQVAAKRINERNLSNPEETSVFDSASQEFQRKIRGFLVNDLKKMFPQRIHIIDAKGTKEEIFSQVIKIINEKLQDKNNT